jgi:hypothetical protein
MQDILWFIVLSFFGMSFSHRVYLELFVLILVVHGEDTFDCTGHADDSYHPIYDTDDCRHYWHCIYVDTVYMHAVRRVCPSGTEFHAILRQCETSSLVSIVMIFACDYKSFV